ncbi:MAG: hypothetical protein K0U68_10785 [Gammaproteobacteria bacterium]|nr:hypothetical protein [Gammaproteobacteria bacterium]
MNDYRAIQAAIQRMATHDQPDKDALVYVGHQHDAIPRAIWYDPALQAIDVRALGLIRTQLDRNQSVSLSLHTVLKKQLGYSKTTVSCILCGLRLSRWITYCQTLRNAAGHPLGHVYAIHDHALSVTETLALDPNYMEFVVRQQQHIRAHIRQLARSILGDDQAKVYNVDLGNPQVHNLDLGQAKVHNVDLGVISKAPKNQSDTAKVHNVDLGLTLCSSSLYKTTTCKNPRARENDFHFPPSFTSAEIILALSRLDQLPDELRQPFLDETAAQIERKRQTQNPIRNPIGYLDWLCSEYSQGNNRLTSLSVRYQEQREQQQTIEQVAQRSIEQFETERRQHEQEIRQETQSTPQKTDRNNRWKNLKL